MIWINGKQKRNPIYINIFGKNVYGNERNRFYHFIFIISFLFYILYKIEFVQNNIYLTIYNI